MPPTVPDILARIADHKRRELEHAHVSRAGLERRAVDLAGTKRDFLRALSSRTPAIIAEIKKASPSKGLLAADFQPVRLAQAYARGGAVALSVLTDSQFFQGSLHDLRAAREAVDLPALRKDFTLDEYHVVEAAAHGSDAILLIAALLETSRLRALREFARTLGMAALVEVHDADELESALDSGAEIAGVNNRNLRTFEVSLNTSLDLAARIPSNVLKVSESGIHARSDVMRLMEAGYSAFLVGEHLMLSSDPAAALAELAGAG